MLKETGEEALGATRRPASFQSQRREMGAWRGGESQHFNQTAKIVSLIFSPSSAAII